MKPRRTALLLLALGVTLGVAIWVFSPWLTGKVEPWDADAPIWSLSWLVVAILGGLAGHVRGVCLPLGYALGQMLVTIQSVVGQFGALGWLFIGGHAVVAVLLTLALIGIVAFLRRVWRTRSATVGGA